MTLRARIILGLLLALYGVVVVRAFQVQVVDGGAIRQRGKNQYCVRVPLVPKRGVILDRTGNELAVSVSTKSIFVQPVHVKDPEKAAAILSPRVGRSIPELRKLFASGKSFTWVRRQMPSDAADEAVKEVREAFRTGRKGESADWIGTFDEPKRYYPNRELAASLIGFTNLDSVGIEGIELSMDKQLRGERAFVTCERDARGHIIAPASAETEIDAKGHSVMLTIDRNIQHVAETELKTAVDKYSARGGTALVMQPRTGEMLAMATLPNYNPNAPTSAVPEARKNHAVTDMMEPGSTFKVFTLASALEMGRVKTTDKFFGENGAYHYAGRVIHDTHKHGWMDVTEVLKYSSNVGAAKISERMDPDANYDMIRTFGFGARTGVELKGEVSGLLPAKKGFRGISQANVSFGQGISVTPIQLVTAMASVINGGRIMKPYLVREVRDPEGRISFRGEPKELRRVISPKTSSQMREIMGAVVEDDGTGTQARIKGFRVGGKTGTAQKVEVGTGRYSPTKRTSSFIGFLPLEDPQLLILVVLDEPKGVVYGGVVAAPAFTQIAIKTAYYLGIRPTHPIENIAKADAPRTGGLKLRPVSTSAPTESTMVMPDLRGMSMGRVVDIMGRYSVRLSLGGSGIAKEQSPEPGTLLMPGMECKISFGGR
ncbi:MAG TPA: penicillin-binding protein [Candidatus Deferrimicrobiaceae bacterium]|jgi:cell division protein FtsI (penicillin-binding protein 3)